MQLKLLYHKGNIDCEQQENCETAMCNRELMLKLVKSLVSPQLMPVIHRIFEVEELFLLADVVSLGENQLHHVLRMCEMALQLKDSILEELGLDRERVMIAVLFHDCGKCSEIDDRSFDAKESRNVKVPKRLRKYGLPDWVEFCSPHHDHIERSVGIAGSYNVGEEVLEAIALHHHVKILPEVLNVIAQSLLLPHVICEDILRHKPEQHAAKGSSLAQVVAVLNQLCAIERKFAGRVYLAWEPEKMEDELVKDLVIGVTGADDPRMKLLDNALAGDETVILLDLRGFGKFVQQNSEYRVQAIKREVLKTIRSVIRVQDHRREKDMAGLIGGDEYAVITKVKASRIIQKMIARMRAAIKSRTGLSVRYGYSYGASIVDNFHEARRKANLKK